MTDLSSPRQVALPVLSVLAVATLFSIIGSRIELVQLNPVQDSAPATKTKQIQSLCLDDVNRSFFKEGRWTVNQTKHETHWSWHAESSLYETSSLSSDVMHEGKLSEFFQVNTNHSLVLYGSSHIRELYMAMIRLELGKPYNEVLSDEIKYLPSGTKYKDLACDPNGPTGWITGLLGVDLSKCGYPGRRIVPELSGKQVAIGFKTFLHTPEADAHFLYFLSRFNLRHPSVLVIDIAIWGARGTKQGGWVNYTLTPEQELKYYLRWIEESFPRTHVVVVYDIPELENVRNLQILAVIEEVFSSGPSPTIVRKDAMVAKKPKDLPCAHGCAGPVVNSIALWLIDWLKRAFCVDVKPHTDNKEY